VKAAIFADEVLMRLGPCPVTRTMMTSAATSVALLIGATLVARAVLHRPGSRLSAAGRLTYRFIQDLVAQSAGRPARGLENLVGALFLFIATAALIGQLPGVPAPTSNLHAASALAVLVFLAVPFFGIRARGPSAYFREYLRPNPLLFPLHLISELSRTLALALRLFGNMMSGNLIVALIVALAGVLVPVPLMALHLLIGILQAYIFAVLASVYVGAAIRVGEGE
jgi:F-type H+-transporting ATPase subunit a